MRNLSVLIALTAFLMSCSGDKQKEDAPTRVLGPKADIPSSLHPLYDSIMWWHDHEAMPRYEPVINAKIQI